MLFSSTSRREEPKMGPKLDLQKYGCPLYSVAITHDLGGDKKARHFAFMCGGGNLGIENKYVAEQH